MLLELAVAAVIGLSFGNAWTCILMSFGTSSDEKKVGIWFILGRFIGLVILGSLISLLRFAASEIMPVVLLIFGVSTLMFGVFMLIGIYLRTHVSEKRFLPFNKRKFSDHVILSLLAFFMVLPRSGTCAQKSNSKKKEFHHNHPHHRKGGKCKKHRILKGKYGFSLGLLRGATPCAKVIVLTPLLVAFGFPQSLLIILVYASVSTVYPIIGYLSADVLAKFERHQIILKILGASILITIGLYSIIKVILWNPTHLGM